jgi:hypothetical protein
MERIYRVWEIELQAVLEINKLGHRKRILYSVSGQRLLAPNLDEINADVDNLVRNFPDLKHDRKVTLTIFSENQFAAAQRRLPAGRQTGDETKSTDARWPPQEKSSGTQATHGGTQQPGDPRTQRAFTRHAVWLAGPMETFGQCPHFGQCSLRG